MTGISRYPLDQFSLDNLGQPVVGLMLESSDTDTEVPVHSHRKGQLVVAYCGGIVCTVEDGIWMVPAGFGVWIPSGIEHSNHVTANGKVCILLIEPGAAPMPNCCCTFALTSLILELASHLSAQYQPYEAASQTSRVSSLLLELLESAATEQLYLPLPKHPKLQKIAKAMAQDPSDRSTMLDWANESAMSERSLARLIKRETGLTFGNWRKQWQIIVALQSLSEGVSVQKTAEALGYCSVSSFISMFKKALGAPPAQYVRHIGGRK